MDILIKINTDNDAFQNGNGPAELARVLFELAERALGYSDLSDIDKKKILDINGNSVGKCWLSAIK